MPALEVDLEAAFRKLESRTSAPAKQTVAHPTGQARLRLWDTWLLFQNKYPYMFAKIDEDPEAQFVVQLKAFFLWYATSRKGIGAERPTTETMVHYVCVFSKANNERSDRKLSREMGDSVREYIKDEVAKLAGLHNRHREKRILTFEDFQVLLYQLWVRDEYLFVHERYRIQLAFFLKVILYTATRPGAVVVSASYRHTNQAITYGDITVKLLRDLDGDENARPEITLTIRFNLMKGEREKEAEFIEITIREDREQPELCPVLDFYVMANADKAWKYFKSSEDLYRYRLPPGRQCLEVKFKDEALVKPVLRMAGSRSEWNTEMSEYKAWTCSSASGCMRELSKRACFKDFVTPYDGRRGSANILYMIASEAELTKQLGHVKSATFQKYLSAHMRIDLQGLFTKGKARQDQIDRLRGMSLSRREGAPEHLPKTSSVEIRTEPGYKVARKKMHDVMDRAKQLISKEPPVAMKINTERFRIRNGVPSFMVELRSLLHDEQRVDEIEPTIVELGQRCREYSNYVPTRRRQKYKTFRNEWFENGTKEDSEFRAPSEEDRERIIPLLEDVPTIAKLRLPITNLMYSGINGTDEGDMVKLISYLTLLCKNDPQFRDRRPINIADPGLLAGPGDDARVAYSDHGTQDNEIRDQQPTKVAAGFVADNGIRDILANWEISTLDLAFPTIIKPKKLGNNALLNIDNISKRKRLAEAQALFLNACKKPSGAYVPLGWVHTDRIRKALNGKSATVDTAGASSSLRSENTAVSTTGGVRGTITGDEDAPQSTVKMPKSSEPSPGSVETTTGGARGALIEGTTQSIAQVPNSLGDQQKIRGKASKLRKSGRGQEGPCSAGKKATEEDSSNGRNQVKQKISKAQEKHVTTESTTGELQGVFMEDAQITQPNMENTCKGKENEVLRDECLAMKGCLPLIARNLPQAQQKVKRNATQSEKRRQPEWFPPLERRTKTLREYDEEHPGEVLATLQFNHQTGKDEWIWL